MVGLSCAVALILLMDVSGSVSADRFKLERDGTAEAIVSPALQTAYDGGVAVSVIQWSDPDKPQVIAVPWTVINNSTDAEKFATKLRSTERTSHGSTGLGQALLRGVEYMQSAPCGDRKVIDVSGDGKSNDGPKPDNVRKIAEQHDITINGLPILSENKFEADVAEYYKDHVVTTNGFTIETTQSGDQSAFTRAMRRKLVLELSQR